MDLKTLGVIGMIGVGIFFLSMFILSKLPKKNDNPSESKSEKFFGATMGYGMLLAILVIIILSIMTCNHDGSNMFNDPIRMP